MVVLRDYDRALAASTGLARLSRSVEVVACGVEEHVMSSYAIGWSGGREAWSISHQAQIDLRHLDASGSLPSAYPDVRDRSLAEQDRNPEGPDYVLDVPVALAERITGFCHDKDPDCGDRPFEILESSRPCRRRWFGLGL